MTIVLMIIPVSYPANSGVIVGYSMYMKNIDLMMEWLGKAGDAKI